jgi:hypothetical protein
MKVEKLYEDCWNSKKNCDVWPERFHFNTTSDCCYVPELVSMEVEEMCMIKCTFPMVRNCIEVCYAEKYNSVTDGRLNLTAIKEAYKANSDSSVNWEKTIEKSVEDAWLTVKKDINDKPVYHLLTDLNTLVDKHFYARCIDFVDYGNVPHCYGFRKFKEHCPETLPPREWYNEA